MSITYILDKNGKRFEKEEWEKVYVDYLQKLYNDPNNDYENPYNDPDSIESSNYEFYKSLEKFLKIQEEKLNAKLKEKWTYKFNAEKENYGIQVKDTNGELFVIFSDQFGFSAPSIKKNHPYDVYAEINNYDISCLKQISEYIYCSRKLGGSFLWPINGGKDYNRNRGGTKDSTNKYYIEDRVDLTLLEVKKYYDKKLDDSIDTKNDILSRYLTDDMKHFLDHFIDFKTYVEFFCFNDFGENNMPISLLSNKDNTNLLDGLSWKRLMINRNKDQGYSKELEIVFNSLKEMINNRTEKMEEILNN